jgi:hypothetical protein
MAATLTSLNIALERVWTQKTLEDQLYSLTPFLDKLKKKERFTVGETARVPLHVGRNGGYTALPDAGGTLNTAGNQQLQKAEYNYKNHNYQIAIQGSALDGTDGKSNSIVDAADLEVKGALTDMNRAITRQLFMNGDSLITACIASATNDVDLNLVAGGHAISRGWLFEGMPVDVGTTANEVLRVDNSLITAISEANTAFTVAAGNITAEDTSDFVSHANSRSGTTSYEQNGLQNVVSATSTLGGLTVAAERQWKSTVNSTSQALTLSLLLQASQQVKQKSGDLPNWVLTGLKQERKFYELLQQQVRYSSDSAIDAGNSDKATWHGMEINADPDCQDADLYMGHYDHLFVVAIDKPYWQNKVTGGQILSWVQGQDAYGAKLTYRSNLATNRRNILYRFSALT